MTSKEAIENPKVWVIKNGDYSVVEVYQKDIGLFTQFFETKEEAEKVAEEYKQAEENKKKKVEKLKGTMTNEEAIDYLKGVRQTIELETVCPFGYYSDSVPYINQAIKALEREETTQWYLSEEFNTWECEKCGHQAHIHGINFCPNCGRKVEK